MYFKHLSIRYKLVAIILFISLVVLVLSSMAFMLHDLWSLQKNLERKLKVQTAVTGLNIVSPLQFDDPRDATEVLASLSEDSDIVLAQVYSANNTTIPFAMYLRKQTPLPTLLGDFEQPQIVSSRDFIQCSQIVVSPNGDNVGLLVLLLDRQAIYDRILWYTMVVILIITVSLLFAIFLSTRLQRIITRPISELAELTHTVSEEKNYSLRAHIAQYDEIGQLFQGFNEMLEAVEERDDKLEQHKEHLERTVAIRTAELKKLNLKLTYQAYHDALTNLPNRALFIKRVEQAIEYAEHNNESLGILFIDLDRFKYINDTLGHAAGDRLLQGVAERLLTCTRLPEDTVARLGGDEFTLLLRDIKEPLDAGMVAEKILKVLTTPLHFHQQEFYITPSIGISMYPKDGNDVVSLMKNADAGMYMAKKQGRNNYRYYTSSANLASAARLSMENKLRQALECDEFEVWYQPRFCITEGKIVGAEALVRWRSPDFNLVPPAQFIPLAEDTGLIIPIGEWVLRTACEENIRWQKEGGSDLHVSVNLSARQFIQENLHSSIEKLMCELNMNPQHLELELTESLIMPNAEDTVDTLQELKRLGVQISIDDFGTGYSSLSYLKRFPIDTLKIDQSFIRDIHENSDDAALVTAIIAMAHNLNLSVVAEGVETPEQLQFLLEHQCDHVQGYLFGKPMPKEEFRSFILNYKDQYGSLLSLS